jgi:hypothetical protein
MKDGDIGGEQLGDVYLVLSTEEAGLVLESLVHGLRCKAYADEPRDKLTALALFLRDFLQRPVDVPASTGSGSEARTAA